MAQPTGGDLHVSRPLTNISVAYMQQEPDFIASTVFPAVPVDFMANSYYKYNKGEWFRTAAKKRAPRTESAGTGWNVTTDTYKAEVQAVHVDIADQDRANQDRPIVDMDRDATLFVTRDMLLRRELDWVDAYFKASIWAGAADQTGAASAGVNQFIQWDRSSATPIEDVQGWRTLMKAKTGYPPNTLVLGQYVFDGLSNSSEIIERIKYSQKGVVTLDLMAAMFNIERVLVPGAVQNTADEGAADAIDFIYGKEALLCYAAPSPGMLVPSAGYTFEWTGYIGASPRGSRMKKFRMEALAADRVEAEMAYDFKQVSSDLGIFLKTVVQ
jgi:hypothetical protein